MNAYIVYQHGVPVAAYFRRKDAVAHARRLNANVCRLRMLG